MHCTEGFGFKCQVGVAIIKMSSEDQEFVTTAKDAHQVKKEETKELCKDMFEKIADYVNGELSGDYYESNEEN